MSVPSLGEPDFRRLDDAAVTDLGAAAVERLRQDAPGPYLFIAEHAGALVPEPWRDLGLKPAFLATHFAVDLGVDALTRRLSDGLQAPAVLARYSRLFLDYNRPADAWDYMRPDLGGIPVPGNVAADAEDRRLRRRVGWTPLEAAIADTAQGRSALVSVHSFTPVMAGVRRDVDIGVLWREPSPFVEAVLALMRKAGAAAGLRIGDNEPYDWRSAVGYTLNRHGLEQSRPCLYLEVRNDSLADREKFGLIAGVLENVFGAVAGSLWPDRTS